METTGIKEMHVIKRSGETETVSFDKILNRVKKIGNEFNLKINYSGLVIKVIDQLHDNISTSKIDELTAEQAASLSTKHPDYGTLASALVVSNLQKNTTDKFSEAMNKLFNFKDVNNSEVPLLSKTFISVVNKNTEFFNSLVDHKRDYLIDYFGFKTLERAYLMHINKKIIERPQYMWLRVAICLHENDLEKVKTTYDLMSQKYFTHATPTLFNAGTPRPQLSSCFLIAMESDSVDGIFNTLKECANISKWAGGIGLHIHNVRGTGSHIRGTNGTSNGIIPMLGVFNKTARYIDQGGGKRAGSFAIYIEPHHPDIEEFLDLKKNHGDEELRARDLFYALWISDLFMERVHTNSKWSLFCSDKTPGLDDCYGEEYKKLYLDYESKNLYVKQINARDLWIKVLDSQMETGTPYMLYKDSVNYKSNQKNLGVIKSSNLCVAPETLILTKNGQEKIEDLKDKEIEVWNGKTFSKTTVYQTSRSSELIEVHTSDGCILSCTKYHKFYIQIKYEKNKKGDIIDSEYVKIVEAKDLKEGMKIIKSEYPVIDNKEKVLENAYSNGFFSGDGTYANITDNKIRLCSFKCSQNEQFCKRHIHNKKIENSELRNDNLCNAYSYEKIKLLENLSYISKGEIKNNKLNVTLVPTLEEKFFVPINYCIKSKIDWFSGYCDADGSISRNSKNQSLQISSIHKEFLINIKLMLQTCGISSVVSLNMDKRKVYLPKNDGSNEYKEYDCKKLWRLLIASNQLQKLLELGFSPKRLIIEQCNYQRSANKFITISKVVDNNRVDKTYCFNEPIRHAGIFNGIITSQCTEITEYSNKDETAVCNLASIGLSKFIKETPNPFTDVTVYSKNDCNWCLLMKALLKKRGINYNEIVLSTDREFSEFKEKNSVETLPQLFDNGVLIGGYNKVEDLLRHKFDYEKLHSVTKIVTENLNKIIDINFYPTEKTKRSNLNHRPIGIGVQGLADVFVLLDLPFESDEAKKVNINIFKTIYHAALEQSNQIAIDRITDIEYLIDEYNSGNWTFNTEDDICTEYNIYNVTDANITNAINNDNKIDRLLNKYRPIRKEIENTWSDKKLCGSYSSFEGSPAHNGILQFDMWNRNPNTDSDINYDWNTLKQSIKEYGLRNSLLVAPMPTASTSQILGNNECFEPFTSNIYSRRTLAGEFIIVNKYLINDLINLGIWDDSIKNNIIQNKGSIQYIDTIPKRLKEKYKIVWEIPMKNLIDMSRDRGAYICQSQSLNLWMEDPTAKSLTNMHFYSWKQGLKTGIYYLRRKPRHQPQQFTIEPESKKSKKDVECDDNGCTMCSG